MSPNVSVVMSVYNGEKYLRPAIESILNQTFSDFEFIIIDDGSTDESAAIINSYNDARIRLIQQENKGLTLALNVGLRAARGKYIARMDADDISHPSRLARQLAYLSQHSEVGVLGTAVQIIDDSGNASGKSRYPTSHEVIRWHLCFNDPIMHPTVMMRRGVVIRAGGYNADMVTAQDYDLWRRLSNVTRLANMNDVLLFLRRHKNSVSSMYSSMQRKNSIRISHLMITSILSENVPIDVLARFQNKDFNTLNDIRKVANLIHRLYQAFVVDDDSLSPAEKQMVRKDAARRLLVLVCQRTYEGYAWDILGLACRLDPLVVGRAAARRLHRILRERLHSSLL